MNEVNEKLSLIEELKTYGVHFPVRDYNPATQTFTDTANGYTTQSLRKELEKVKHAEEDARTIWSDKKQRNALVQWELRGDYVLPPKGVSSYAMKYIKPVLEKYVYQLKVDEEAKRRIEQQKKDKEKRTFEEAVKRRMAELGYPDS